MEKSYTRTNKYNLLVLHSNVSILQCEFNKNLMPSIQLGYSIRIWKEQHDIIAVERKKYTMAILIFDITFLNLVWLFFSLTLRFGWSCFFVCLIVIDFYIKKGILIHREQTDATKNVQLPQGFFSHQQVAEYCRWPSPISISTFSLYFAISTTVKT